MENKGLHENEIEKKKEINLILIIRVEPYILFLNEIFISCKLNLKKYDMSFEDEMPLSL